MSLESNFAIYKEAVDALERNGIRYVIGGGIAIMAYGRVRDTKDIDLYIEGFEEERALRALAEAGFQIEPMPDVYWLSKGYKDGITVDFILENVGGIHTTTETLDHGFKARLCGHEFLIMAPEDLIIRKIMAMRSERDDWYDCISVLSSRYDTFDWPYFIKLAKVSYERTLSFLLYVRSDQEHVVPVPDAVISGLVKKLDLKDCQELPTRQV